MRDLRFHGLARRQLARLLSGRDQSWRQVTSALAAWGLRSNGLRANYGVDQNGC